jgi:hypothetical protein
VTTTPPNKPGTDLSDLLSPRGWQLNTELAPTGEPLWDFMESRPSSKTLARQGYPTGIFIHAPEEPGFCTVEPATWSTQRNPYQRTFRRVADLISWLPHIEKWRAPATTTHKSPLELAQMRAEREITTAELLHSLNHFPYPPRRQFPHRSAKPSTHGSIVGGQYHVLIPLLDAGLLSPAEFEFLT